MLSRGVRDDVGRKHLLTRAVKHLKDLFLIKMDARPRSFEEILKETYNTDMYHTVKEWVSTVGLHGVDRVEVTQDGKFVYKPPLPCRDVKSLWALLQENESQCRGMLWRDVLDSIPGVNAAVDAINSLKKKLDVLGPPENENLQVLKVKDKLSEVGPVMTPECVDLWRKMDTSQVDDRVIEAQLRRTGMSVKRKKFAPLLDSTRRRVTSDTVPDKSSTQLPANIRHIKLNSHVMEDLEDYSGPGAPLKRKGRKRK